jgi:hypothetical protein
MAMTKTKRALAALALAGLAAGCDESDVVSVRIRLAQDLSGRIATSCVRIPDPAAPMEHISAGVTWQSRLHVVTALGTFASLSDVRIEDITFAAQSAGETLNSLEVVLPRGPDARWPRVLVPLSEDERRQAAETLDLSGRMRAVGSEVKIEIELPSRVIGHGLSARAHGAKEKTEADTATLIVPLAGALEQDEPLIWNLTWRRQAE